MRTGIPSIVQINVADANIVDRCESCHMGIREPIRITPAVMTPKGEKTPDEYAQAFVSHPRPGLVEDSRSRQVRLLSLSSGQRPRHHQRGESAWQLRALALAAVPQGKCRSRLPELPRRRHAPGERRRGLAPSAKANTSSASAAAWAAIATKDTTRSPKI